MCFLLFLVADELQLLRYLSYWLRGIITLTEYIHEPSPAEETKIQETKIHEAIWGHEGEDGVFALGSHANTVVYLYTLIVRAPVGLPFSLCVNVWLTTRLRKLRSKCL
jgi:hypothetical protein